MIQHRLARNLKQLRKTRGLTQEALARKAGFTLPYIGRIEIAAHPEVPISTLERLAKALKVPVAALLE